MENTHIWPVPEFLDKMDNIYSTGKALFYGQLRNYILIPRKPSQIPIHIDREIMHSGAICHMDGPNNRVLYEIMFDDKFEKIKDYLNKCGWKETI